MFRGFLISCEKGGMEDRMDFPPRGNMEAEGHVGDDFFYFKRTSSFHLEFLGSINVEVGSLEPDLVSYPPGSKLGGYSFFHFLLGHFVGGLGVIMSSR